jgi:hypothetical protein
MFCVVADKVCIEHKFGKKEEMNEGVKNRIDLVPLRFAKKVENSLCNVVLNKYVRSDWNVMSKVQYKSKKGI